MRDRIRNAWDYVVVYAIPGFIYRPWTRYIWRPVRYGSNPWAKSACDECPWCIAAKTEPPPPLSPAARALANSPNRPVFKADPDRLFPFQQRWERPDQNPFPNISLWRNLR